MYVHKIDPSVKTQKSTEKAHAYIVRRCMLLWYYYLHGTQTEILLVLPLAMCSVLSHSGQLRCFGNLTTSV